MGHGPIRGPRAAIPDRAHRSISKRVLEMMRPSSPPSSIPGDQPKAASSASLRRAWKPRSRSQRPETFRRAAVRLGESAGRRGIGRKSWTTTWMFADR